MARPFRTRTGDVECQVDTSRLNEILQNLPGNTEDAVRAIAFTIEGNAKKNAPVDFGALMNSIYVRVGDDPAPLPQLPAAAEAARGPIERVELPAPQNSTTAHVGPSVEYGVYVELGTSSAAAQPFLGPAVNQAADELARRFRRVVTNE